MTYTMSDAAREQRRQASREHGLTTDFAKGTADETTLQPEQRTRLAELREALATPAGAREALVERAARLVLVAEWGEEWLRSKAEAEGAVAAFTSPIMARFFTAAAEARRALVEVAKIHGTSEGGMGAEDVLKALRNGKQ
jgi:hypothetical protein